MKFLIFGATGFIGSKIAESLINEGHKVINVSRFDNEENLCIKTLTYKEEYSIIEELKSSDGAIFSAGKRLNKEFSYKDYMENVELLSKILNYLKISNQKNCVFLSSIGVYGDYNSPWTEETVNIPSNLYALSKKHQDDLIEFFNYNYGMNFKILRLAQVMGLGERKGYLFNTFFDNAINNIDLTIMGTGKGKRQYIYIKDIVNVVKKLLNFKDIKGIYNLGLENTTSIEELAFIMKKILNPKIKINYLDYKYEDLVLRNMDVSKLKEKLNIIPEYSLEEAIIDMRKDLEKNSL